MAYANITIEVRVELPDEDGDPRELAYEEMGFLSVVHEHGVEVQASMTLNSIDD